MTGTTEKICPNCGEVLSSDFAFCLKCGAKLDEDTHIVEETSNNFLKKNKNIIITGAVAIIGILIVVFIVNSVQISNLKKELRRDWSRVEGSNGSYINCILDFSDDEIEYRLETGYAWLNTTVATYDYKVVNGNKIKVLRYSDKWEPITIEFNEDKTMMTVSPALTSVDNKEYWFNLD